MQKLNFVLKKHLLLIALFCCPITLAANGEDINQALALNLSIDRQALKEQRLVFKIVLVNKTHKTLTINIPTYANQLAVYRTPLKGAKEYMAHLIKSLNGRCNDPAEILVLAPKSALAYNRVIELPDINRKSSTAQPITYKAVFELYKSTQSNAGITSIKSNTVQQ